MKKNILNTFFILSVAMPGFTQIVNIPDANFKAYLVGNTAVNTNADTEIQVSEATAFTGNFFANNLGITDLTGLEAFVALDGLYVRDNNLGTIDISANTALTYIDCQSTSISTIDLSNNTALTGINCSYNNLTSLDVSNNTALTAINCSGNNLTTLDVSNNTLLSNFSCDNNNLASIDVSNNTDLLYFVCHFNNLTAIDLSSNTALSWFSCSGNNISSLDLSNNVALGNLFCAQNDIVSLNLSANPALIVLNCTDNDLSYLNVSNGNNTNFVTYNSLGNPNLACIQVDDVSYSDANWTDVDATSSFSTFCSGLGLNSHAVIPELMVYPNPAQHEIAIKGITKAESFTIANLQGQVVMQGVTEINGAINIKALHKGIYMISINKNAPLKFTKH